MNNLLPHAPAISACPRRGGRVARLLAAGLSAALLASGVGAAGAVVSAAEEEVVLWQNTSQKPSDANGIQSEWIPLDDPAVPAKSALKTTFNDPTAYNSGQGAVYCMHGDITTDISGYLENAYLSFYIKAPKAGHVIKTQILSQDWTGVAHKEITIEKADTWQKVQIPIRDMEQNADFVSKSGAISVFWLKNERATQENALLAGSVVYLADIKIAVMQSVDIDEPPAPYGATPNAAQLEYHQESLAAFLHYGMNTFTNKQWGDGTEDPKDFAPETIDADGYVKALKDAGFKRLIITAKHHDGFCIWPSAYTTHDVESSSYDGDPLAEFSAACTKYDMDMGIYLSPWDRNASSYGYGPGGSPDDDKNGDYNAYYLNQLEEILSNPKYGNNGKFVEWWLDGAKGEGEEAQEYDFDAWEAMIRRYNPDCQIFGLWPDGGIHWIGNELGIAPDETWCAYSQYWSVPECDVPMTKKVGNWFYNEGDVPKSMEELANIYFSSIGHGATLLMNVPMDTAGKIPDDFADSLARFSQAIRQTFATDLARGEGVTAEASSVRGTGDTYAAANVLDGDPDTYWTMSDGKREGSLTVRFDSPQTFNVVSIEEYIPLGQRVSSFKVEYRSGDGDWQLFGEGATIGAKRLVRNHAVTATEIRISVLEARAVPLLSSVGVFKSAVAFSLDDDGVDVSALEATVGTVKDILDASEDYVDNKALADLNALYEQARSLLLSPDSQQSVGELDGKLKQAMEKLCLKATREALEERISAVAAIELEP